ncbi:hypothetical protein ACOSQ4_017296 [Xanthoceras sorbifolium]
MIYSRKHYSQESLAKITQLRSQMHHTKKGNLAISEYVLKIKTLADCLVAAGQLISYQDLLVNILEGFSNQFDVVVVNITSMQRTIYVQEAQFLLMNYEARMNQQASSASLTISCVLANYTQSNFQRGGNYEMKKRSVCQLCGRSGHYSTICFHRFDQSFQGNRPPNGQ